MRLRSNLGITNSLLLKNKFQVRASRDDAERLRRDEVPLRRRRHQELRQRHRHAGEAPGLVPRLQGQLLHLAKLPV